MNASKKSQAIDQILDQLAKDKAWHNIDEIAEKTQLTRSETTHIIEFLATHSFIQLDEHNQKAKIEEKTAKFLKQIFKKEQQINELNVLH